MNVCGIIPVSTLADNSELAGAANGLGWCQRARPALESAGAGLLVLDFAGIRVATVSWLREAVIGLLRHAATLDREVILVVANTSDLVREELQIALDATNNVVILAAIDDSGTLSAPELAGRLDPALEETLRVVREHSIFDASLVSRTLPHVRLSAANNRLAALESKGVLRSTRRGRRRLYSPVLEGLRHGS